LIDLLLDPWRSGIGARALAEVLLLALFCGPLSFWVVSFRLSYAAESLAHSMLPGLVIAATGGVALLAGGAGGVLVAAALIALAARDSRLGEDRAVAVVVTGMLGLGGLLALSADVPPRLQEILFGDPLAASGTDIATAVALLVVGGIALAALRRPLAVVAFDPAGAAALGLHPARLSLALLGLLAAASAVAVTGLGNLLVLALLVAPALAVRRHVRSPTGAMAGGAFVAVAAGLTGVYLSFHLDIAAGAAIALALCAAALAGALLPGRRELATA
jgi:ABC-type Mn2+/Zn2+ transport system permease subunit